MIEKETLQKMIEEFQLFMKGIERVEEAISGRKYGLNLAETDWYTSVDKMFNIFIESYFTDMGSDWVYYYIFEDYKEARVGDKIYPLDTIDNLWEFLQTDPKLYFKNA